MELGVPGVVGSVVQEHEEIRSKNLEKLAKSRKVATKAVEKAGVLLQPDSAVTAEKLAKGQTEIDRATRSLQEDTRELEQLAEDWSHAFGDISKELVLMGDLRDWSETMELHLRSIKAELEHSGRYMVHWQRLHDQK